MGDTRSGYSDYVEFILKSEFNASFVLTTEPEGWEDDELELTRHKDYHGIFTSFSSKLKFTREAKDYILNAYELGGINTDLRLTKRITKDVENGQDEKNVKWVERYSAIADFSTMVVKDDKLEIKFNSNDLAELIKSHESDDFELERLDSIDGVELETLNSNLIDLEGRTIGGSGESALDFTNIRYDANGVAYEPFRIPRGNWIGPPTRIITQGTSDRHKRTSTGEYNETNPADPTALESMFFSDSELEGSNVNLSFTISTEMQLIRETYLEVDTTRCNIVRYRWTGTNYEEVEIIGTFFSYTTFGSKHVKFNISKSYNVYNLAFDEGIAIRFESDGDPTRADIFSFNINLNITETYEVTKGVKFIFVHDAFERLTQILTGEKNRFASRFYGRTELLDQEGNQMYSQDGVSEDGSIGGGLIGFTSGYWVRKFDPASEKYKSPKISLKDLIDSSRAIFNTGIGIEVRGFKEILRVEEKKYFYRDEVAVKLPFQITKVERKVDNNQFFSGVTLGYSKGGNYENQIGLDEPNTQTSWVTPIRKSKNKYSVISKLRADEYGMEITRRKPQQFFPDEDTPGDDDNWVMDLKRDPVSDFVFNAAEWPDRLSEMPTGIYNPDSFRSMIFTPLRLLFRHGWVLRAGMEKYLDKMIKYTSSIANTELGMTFSGEDNYFENQDILVSDLDRSRILPEEVKFEHPVDEDLIDQIYGTTKALVNGNYEDVPNFYFKFEYINENGEVERGYMQNLKPTASGKFTMIKANERILNQ